MTIKLRDLPKNGTTVEKWWIFENTAEDPRPCKVKLKIALEPKDGEEYDGGDDDVSAPLSTQHSPSLPPSVRRSTKGHSFVERRGGAVHASSISLERKSQSVAGAGPQHRSHATTLPVSFVAWV